MRIISIFVACMVAGGLIFFFNTRAPSGMKTQELRRVDTKELQAEREGRYYNERYGFSFLRPESVRIHERKEGADAATIRVENEREGQGFQVFVVAYSEEAISDERFRMDLPSGVRKQEEAIVLSGIPATAFLSEDAALGATREVWFLREGYLYEITAPVSSEVWLQEVLKTWNFEQIVR